MNYYNRIANRRLLYGRVGSYAKLVQPVFVKQLVITNVIIDS